MLALQALHWGLSFYCQLFTAFRVKIGYSDTFTDPRECHCNHRPLYYHLKEGCMYVVAPNNLELLPAASDDLSWIRAKFSPCVRSFLRSFVCKLQTYFFERVHTRCRYSQRGRTILVLLPLWDQWHLLSVYHLEKVWLQPPSIPFHQATLQKSAPSHTHANAMSNGQKTIIL